MNKVAKLILPDEETKACRKLVEDMQDKFPNTLAALAVVETCFVHLPFPVLILDLEGHVLEANELARDLKIEDFMPLIKKVSDSSAKEKTIKQRINKQEIVCSTFVNKLTEGQFISICILEENAGYGTP